MALPSSHHVQRRTRRHHLHQFGRSPSPCLYLSYLTTIKLIVIRPNLRSILPSSSPLSHSTRSSYRLSNIRPHHHRFTLPLNNNNNADQTHHFYTAMNKSLTSFTALTPANLPGEDTTTRALTYPYDRPPHGYIFHAGKPHPLPSTLSGLPLPLRDYIAVVSIGSNGAPEQLRRKYGDGDNVFIPVLAAHVHNADFVFAANVSGYGSVASTVMYSGGTIVHTHVTLLTKVEFERMNLTEGGYHLCKLALPQQQQQKGGDDKVVNGRGRNGMMSCPFVEIVEFEDFTNEYDRDHIMMYVAMSGPLLLNMNNNDNTSAGVAVPVAFDSFVAQHRVLDAADQRMALEQVARLVKSPFDSVEQWIRHLVAHPEYRLEVVQQIQNKEHVHDDKHFEIMEQLAID